MLIRHIGSIMAVKELLNNCAFFAINANSMLLLLYFLVAQQLEGAAYFTKGLRRDLNPPQAVSIDI